MVVFFDYCFEELRASEFPKLSPKETVIIGDSISSDISGGIKYGMHTCLYQKNTVPNVDLFKVDHVVASLAEIERIL